MKRQMSFLRKLHRSLLTDSSYSTASTCVVWLVFMLLAISCGPLPTGEFNVPETTTTTAEKTTKMQSKQSKGSLPESATVDLQKLPYFRNAFKQLPRVRSRRALSNFHLQMREMGQHSAIITNCSFDVLKAFVAKGWAPIVMIQLQSRTPVISPLSHYDNQSSEVHLQNPTSSSKRQLTYEEFEKSWEKDTQKRGILITPQRLTEADVRKVLGEYLPAEAFQQINVNSH